MPRKRRKSSVYQKGKYAWKKQKSNKMDDNCDLEPEQTWPTTIDSIMTEILSDVHHKEAVSADTHEVCGDEATCEEYTHLQAAEHQVLDLPNSVNSQTQTETFIETAPCPLQNLRQQLQLSIEAPYMLTPDTAHIQIIELYRPGNGEICVKQSIVIEEDFSAMVFVHRKEVSKTNDVWFGLPATFMTVESVQNLLLRLKSFNVCIGNPDEEYQDITPIGSGISDGFTNEIRSYREGNFSASKGNLSYSSTIRSVKCALLVKGNRCSACLDDRRMLRKRHQRAEERLKSPPVNFVHHRYQHKYMSKQNLVEKINQQKTELKSMAQEIEKLKRKFQKEIQSEGVELDVVHDMELRDLMSSCQADVVNAYPDQNCLQRLFWEQQLKYQKSSKYGMRWHPMIIRWCLYLRSKSSKAYDAMKDSGFVQLPSTRTLFDYSHYIKSALGFQPDVTKMLHEEAQKLGMYEEGCKGFVGLLFDEIRIKEDLVYDKHSGELIGFCNLDSVGNQLMALEKIASETKKSELAKFMLVIMVRGIITNLKFPFAGFATNSITADFLYPIIWKAVSILETVVKLKVLFCTCDGASANRKFFQLHQLNCHNINNQEPVYYTVNPHEKGRNLYFISDVPHLLKTARNCLSNSYSHKNSRRMWKDGKDLSWMHLVRLYEQHCELEIFNMCPKLSRSHIDLTAFNCMKVNLAAQVLSENVANALENLFDDSVSETVLFIRKFNKFFDCLNVRSCFEGRNKRNPNLEPYSDINDNRLEWLRTNFLGCLEEWRQSVEGREGNFSSANKTTMQLSRQTLNGLKISIKSITECVHIMLQNGAQFVLTHRFNQDPLEQHFGHYRHKGGANNNPTVYEVRNTMTQLRTVGAQALAPRNGNIHCGQEHQGIDNTNLPRRR